MFSQCCSHLHERVAAFVHITNRAGVSATVLRSNADVMRRSASGISRWSASGVPWRSVSGISRRSDSGIPRRSIPRRSISAMSRRLGMSASCALFAVVNSIDTLIGGETGDRGHPFAERMAHSSRGGLYNAEMRLKKIWFSILQIFLFNIKNRRFLVRFFSFLFYATITLISCIRAA